MVYENQQLTNLVEKARKDGFISNKEILSIIDEDSDDYDELMKIFEKEDIEVKNDGSDDDEDEEMINVDPDDLELGDDFEGFIGDIENDADFAVFTSDIENEVKNKDIEDLVGPSTSISSDDPIKMYLREIGQIPLLTTNRELELSRAVQEGIVASHMMEDIKLGERTATEEELAELELAITEGQEATNILIESNLRLVVHVAKKFMYHGMQLQDLIQEGNIGLMKAVKKFDYTRGYKFSTYATWWIKQSITRAIADQARTIRIPVHMVETINRMARIRRKLAQDLHREPTPQEIANEMGITVEKVQQIQHIAQEPASLEKPVGEEDDSTLGDFVSDDNTMNPLEYTLHEKYKEEIDKCLKELTPREEAIIRLRYGLADGCSHTLEEIGAEYDVTRERIRQIQVKALKRLHQPARKRKLEAYKDYSSK
ncbi:MAG: RNA polymerase sigma factor RpoD [Bacilli bacterium]|nr:RNA polymerase sigma factor RpoD [Bacilli bacterium]